jgi:hypothetical protein
MSTTFDIKRFLFSFLFLIGLIFSMGAYAHGPRDYEMRDYHPQYHHNFDHHPHFYQPQYHAPRFHRDYYYPRYGQVVDVLPPRHQVVVHEGRRFFHANGVWYEPSGVRFMISTGPIGFIAASFD